MNCPIAWEYRLLLVKKKMQRSGLWNAVSILKMDIIADACGIWYGEEAKQEMVLVFVC
ncbi:hypothetical protein PVOR_18984 [Paenibacillus vortex V453]|uniref:Uncharacterized protein n=1 Tax=Paenibacillus vortex V453 TaxID=715225 RepID=A0A2R9SSZ3_9BACL|nr:hypothetical protein PVOR_18984 [Paenibacillus vortex V453]